jgi:hypothetical protein
MLTQAGLRSISYFQIILQILVKLRVKPKAPGVKPKTIW